MIKKLIEVSIPLDLINDESAYDKMPGIGAHPKGLHHWWARLPLPTARAVLFASLVDDPSSHPDRFPTEAAQLAERERLFGLMRNLLQKKIHTKPQAYRDALEEIKKHCNGQLPTVHDPFSGGGSIPLEGMRMGLPVIAADLNPVAVLINKAMLEILPRFANQLPINPDSQKKYSPGQEFTNARGLAEDVRYYGRLINEEAKKRIGHLYPPVTLPDGRAVPVLTYMWARTVECPNPACGCQMPLVGSFILKKRGKETLYISPLIERNRKNIITGYEIKSGEPEVKGTVISKSGARCIACGEVIAHPYIRQEGLAKRISHQLMCVSADTGKGRAYIYDKAQEFQPKEDPKWIPEIALAHNPKNISPPLYGMTTYDQLFTKRQLIAYDTLSSLIAEFRIKLITEGNNEDYANAITVFLSFAIDRLADFNNSLTTWKPSGEQQMHLFTRQSIPMVWDYSEANILCDRSICWLNAVDITSEAIDTVLSPFSSPQQVIQKSATDESIINHKSLLVSTDPPYYNNIPYADVSDFFYVWLRHNLKSVYPDVVSTMDTPKRKELVAAIYRFEGDKQAAHDFFVNGFIKTFSLLRQKIDNRFPLTVYYAFKQGEEKEESQLGLSVEDLDTKITGWESLLESLIKSGFQITATWPIKASQQWRMVSMPLPNSWTGFGSI